MHDLVQYRIFFLECLISPYTVLDGYPQYGLVAERAPSWILVLPKAQETRYVSTRLSLGGPVTTVKGLHALWGTSGKKLWPGRRRTTKAEFRKDTVYEKCAEWMSSCPHPPPIFLTR